MAKSYCAESHKRGQLSDKVRKSMEDHQRLHHACVEGHLHMLMIYRTVDDYV